MAFLVTAQHGNTHSRTAPSLDPSSSALNIRTMSARSFVVNACFYTASRASQVKYPAAARRLRSTSLLARTTNAGVRRSLLRSLAGRGCRGGFRLGKGNV